MNIEHNQVYKAKKVTDSKGNEYIVLKPYKWYHRLKRWIRPFNIIVEDGVAIMVDTDQVERGER